MSIALSNIQHRFHQHSSELSGPALQLQNSLTDKQMAAIRLDIVIPVYNESKTIETQITTLNRYIEDNLSYDYRIVIADNGSTDQTLELAQQLAQNHARIAVVHLEQKGRGRALKQVWLQSSADILAYMDLDLSTDLASLEPLLAPLAAGQSRIATGSRLKKASTVTRGLKREFISRSYNKILRTRLGLKTTDAQCGFKAIRADYAKTILPQVVDNDWFFDTELLVRAEHSGETVHEVAVTWQDDPDSSVNIHKTAIEDLKGVHRLRSEYAAKHQKERVILAIILIASFVLYGYGASRNGFANSFYAAAVQAGTKSWKAFFFGSLDASNFITVDKPPFSLWMMELSARIFGFHAWSMLLPDILAGVGTVAIVYASVRRWFSANSALLAAGVMALTPIAVVMFGFDNPDGILTLLLAGSAYAMLRALENVNPLRWLSIAAVLTGFAFTTKMLQGLIVLPVLAAVYLICAKPRFLIRLKHLLLASIPLIIFTLWWPVLVSVTPVNDRPYIGSSGNNSIWSLIVGYNGFGRLLGTSSGMGGANGKHGHSTGFNLSTTTKGGTAASQTIPSFSGTSFSGFPGSGGKTGGFAGAGHGGPGGSGFGGSVGVLRIFNSDFGPNIGWYIPAGLISTAFVLWQRRKKARTDRVRAAFLLWSGYVVLHIIVFSLVSGVIHPYYPVVMAPAIAALIGMGAPILFDAYKRRTSAALVLPAVVALTGIVAAIMLDYEPLWFPELRIFILIASIISALGLIVHLYFPKARLSQLSLIIACIACCAGPVAYSLDSVTVTHTGSIPSAGPSGTGMAGSNNETASVEKSLATYLEQHRDGAAWIVAVNSANESAPIQLTTGEPVMAVGGFDGSDTAISLKNFEKLVSSGKLRYYAVSTGKGLAGGGFNRGGRSVILDWVEAHSSKVSYGGTDYTLYKLSV